MKRTLKSNHLFFSKTDFRTINPLDKDASGVIPRKIINCMIFLYMKRDITLCKENKNRIASKYYTLDVQLESIKHADTVKLCSNHQLLFPMTYTNEQHTAYCLVVAFPARKEILFFNMDNRLLNEEIKSNLCNDVKEFINNENEYHNEEKINWKNVLTPVNNWEKLPTITNVNDSSLLLLKTIDFLSDSLPFDFDQISFKSFRNSITISLRHQQIPY